MAITAKIYQNLRAVSYSTDILVDGHRVDLSFSLGAKMHPDLVFGKLFVSDPKIMKVLDESPRYGKDWVVLEEVRDNAVERIDPVQGVVVERVLEPQSANAARNWLNKNKGVPFSKMTNKESVMRMAQQINVEFPNVT